ncbi:hypothetical protein Gotri_024896, partial [Gossypium trilobum]|nr:hypothetical protein [Gossypium trilobum]
MHNEVLSRRRTSFQRYSHSENWFHLYTDGAINLNRHCIRGGSGTDSLEIIHALQRSISAISNSALVRRIHQFLLKNKYWVARYIPKKTNHVVNQIAKMVLESDEANGAFDL